MTLRVTYIENETGQEKALGGVQDVRFHEDGSATITYDDGGSFKMHERITGVEAARGGRDPGVDVGGGLGLGGGL